jgi:hypothetical protein
MPQALAIVISPARAALSRAHFNQRAKTLRALTADAIQEAANAYQRTPALVLSRCHCEALIRHGVRFCPHCGRFSQ